jgi:hypothetical protein
MAHRHDVHKKARGGALHEGKREVYAGGASNVAKEAEHDLHKHGGRVHGHKGKHRMKKKRGGGVGSDNNPFTSAEKSESAHPGGQKRVKIPLWQAGHGKG